MSDSIRDILNDLPTDNVLPLAYCDLREWIRNAHEDAVKQAQALFGASAANEERSRNRIEELATAVKELKADNQALRLEIAVLKESVHDTAQGEGVSRPLASPMAISAHAPYETPGAPSTTPLPAGITSSLPAASPIPTTRPAQPQTGASNRNVTFPQSVVIETMSAASRGAVPNATDPVPTQPPLFPNPPLFPPPFTPFPHPTPPPPAPPSASYAAPADVTQPGMTPGFGAVQPLEVPGLEPMTTLLDPFKRVVDYRTYRLKERREEPYANELSRVSSVYEQCKNLYPIPEPFSGDKPMKLLGLLYILKLSFDTLGISEAVACRAMGPFLTGEAAQFWHAQIAPGFLAADIHRRYTWPNMVDSFLKRYLTDDVLSEALNKVTRISQKTGENEQDYAARLLSAAQECCNVFSERELVNHYVSGLRPTTRSSVSEKLLTLGLDQRSNFTVVRRVAVAEGNTYRARLKDVGAKPKRSALVVTSDHTTRAQPAAHPPHMTGSAAPVEGPPLPASFATPSDPRPPSWNTAPAPVSPLDVVRRLDTIFLMAKQPLSGATTGPTSYDEQMREILSKPREDAPVLTAEQRELAFSVIPTDAWQMSCWACRDPGHSLFTCPKMTEDQRLFFAYKYYLHKVQENPSLASFYRERLQERRHGAVTSPNTGRYDRHYVQNRSQNDGRGADRRGNRRQDHRPGQRGRGYGNVYVVPTDEARAMQADAAQDKEEEADEPSEQAAVLAEEEESPENGADRA